MENFLSKLRRIEFETRIFISLGIVLYICIFSFFILPETKPFALIINEWVNLIDQLTISKVYLFLSLSFIIVSLLRMWSGSMLTSHRVMAFKVQTDSLIKEGPYILVRNPIYLADWLAITGFVLVLPPFAILMPVLFYLHYFQLIKYEEKSLGKNFMQDFNNYKKLAPRLFPSIKSILNFIRTDKKFFINYDGFRHNALYILFIPGFLVAAFTNNLLYAIVIGIPGVIDWAVIHTKIGIDKGSAAGNENTIKRKKKKVFTDILYAQCWEDPRMDRIAFKITNDDVVFSITSGGCNVLTFLLDDPERIIALDLNPYQNYLLEFKLAAFRKLSYEEMLEIIGVRKSTRRRFLFTKIRSQMSLNARNYWDKNLMKIEKGIINCGRYEKYMRILRVTLKLIHGPKLLKKFFEIDDECEREKLYEEKFNNLRWRLFTRVLLSKRTMSLLFNKDFFKYLEKSISFGKHFENKAKYALTKLAQPGNYFLAYILLGKYYDEQNLPDYLQERNFETIKNRIYKVEVITANCNLYFNSLRASSISKFNFTNIFEWMSPQDYEDLLWDTIRVSRDHSIITYRNLLVEREHPSSLDKKLNSNKKLAQHLLEKDRSFIYNNYVVEVVEKESGIWNIEPNRLPAETSSKTF